MTQPHAALLDTLRAQLNGVVLGKEDVIEQLLVGVLAGGHVLLEDVPGVGKTTLAKALAITLGLDFSRVQFTPDLLPGDIVGSQVLDPKEGSFRFLRGPVFTEVLLADEINRASPRTQSALLEAMSEGQVTVEGTTWPLSQPFFVLATQNPVDFQGTYPLPEAQLDRFLLRLTLGYPSHAETLKMLYAHQHSHPLDGLQPVTDRDGVLALQAAVREVHVEKEVGDYLLRLVEGTRRHAKVDLGLSPRGALACFRAAQACAFLQGRSYVSPADLQALAVPTMAHRLMLAPEARYGGTSPADIIDEVVAATDVPG
jgi:MoxR-like ATPase